MEFERLTILIGQLYKSIAPNKYFFKVPLIGRFMPLIGVIRGPVESPLYTLYKFNLFEGQTSLGSLGTLTYRSKGNN